MSGYLTRAIPGAAVPGFIPGRPLDVSASSGAAVTPAILACAITLPPVTVGARMKGRAVASVTNQASATASVSSKLLATAGVS